MNEAQIQKTLIRTLVNQGYTYGNRQNEYSSLENIKTIFKDEIERLNKKTYSVDEFKQLLSLMENVNMEKAYNQLRYGIELTLEDNTNTIVKLFDTVNYNNNHFHVVDEVVVKGLIKGARLDLVILMNGLPILASELKAPGAGGIDKAIMNINSYTQDGVYRIGLLRYIQIYVGSDDVHTRYQSTLLASGQGESYKRGFSWADRENKRINRLIPSPDGENFAQTFLKPEMLCKILSQYMLLIPSGKKTCLILRPYQIYAVEAGMERLKKKGANGFFWHATGSGKTLTSYMLTKSITENSNFHKTIMLLDRNDLADQTIDEYNKFKNNGTLVVTKGKELKNALEDDTVKTVITTIQSFSKRIKRQDLGEKIKKTLDYRTCFIIDECHRSTFGKMFTHISKKYSAAQFIGFTGTPIFAENCTQDYRLTKDIFDEPIHTYTIKDAISDGNVLGFELKEVQIEGNNPDIIYNKDYWSSPQRVSKIVDYIARNYRKHTAQGDEIKNKERLYSESYNAMLATDSVESAYTYWKKLNPLFKKQGRTVATIFSVENKEEDEGNGTSYQWYREVLKDYDNTFGTNFTSLLKEGLAEARKNHLSDLMKRVKNKQIDLVIVSHMLLTGFDAQTLNTIYLDKNLKHHTLLQAISRTNRVHPSSDKKTGTVIVFSDRGTSPKIDEAIMMFSNGDNIEGVVRRREYNELYNQIIEQSKDLAERYSTADAIDNIDDIENLLEAARLYSVLNTNIKRIQTYDEWEEADWAKLTISKDELARYSSAIINKRDLFFTSRTNSIDTNIWDELDFTITKIRTTTIDIAYINELLRNAVYAPEKEKEKWFIQVRKAINLSTDKEVLARKEPFLAMLDRRDEITSNEKLHEIYAEETIIRELERYSNVANKYKFTTAFVQELMDTYKATFNYPATLIDPKLNELGYGALQKNSINKNLKKDLEALLELR